MQEPHDSTLQRLAYLQAMGVPGFVSRRQAPGAAPSRRLAVVRSHAGAQAGTSAALTEPVGAAPQPAAGAAARPAARVRPKLDLPELDADSTRVPSKTEAGAAAASSAASSSACRFTLVTMLAGRWLWLESMDDMPLASDQVALVQAMAYALAFPTVGDAIPAPEVATFDWPMHNNRQLDSGSDAARASLSAFLLRRVQQQRCAGIVLLGEACERWVELSQVPVPAVTIASSAQMLARPELKPAAWRALQSFRPTSAAIDH